MGLDIPSATMGDQIRWGAELLEPITNALLADIIASETMHVDGTSLPVLDRDTQSHRLAQMISDALTKKMPVACDSKNLDKEAPDLSKIADFKRFYRGLRIGS